MSSVNIIGFDENGKAFRLADVDNAWDGAMAIWYILEQRHLGPFVPTWARDSYGPNGQEGKRYSRVSIANETREGQSEIWELFSRENVSVNDRIALGTTFSKVVVRKEEIPRLLEAFRGFADTTNLSEQADEIEEALKSRPSMTGIGWSNSVEENEYWMRYQSDGEERKRPYNLLKDEEHWFLFEELKVPEEAESTTKVNP